MEEAGRPVGPRVPSRSRHRQMDAVERRALDVVRRVVALDAIPAELDP